MSALFFALIKRLMHQLEFFELPSPCIGVCQSGPRGYCLGCFRSREERQHWLNVDDSTKRIIIRACNRRKKIYLAKKAAENDPQPHFNQGELF